MPPKFLNASIFVVCLASASLADDFKTLSGKEYKNATVTRVEPDGIVIKFHGGIVKIPFTNLSEDLRHKYNYDPSAARQFAADEQQQINKQNQWESREPSDPRRYNLDLLYYPPEGLSEKAQKVARDKMLSSEEEKRELSKIPAGGGLYVSLHAGTGNTANTKSLTYIIGNSTGDILTRKRGNSNPTSREYEYWYKGFDWVDLPAFDYSLRIRVYHEVLGDLGDYVIQRTGGVTRLH